MIEKNKIQLILLIFILFSSVNAQTLDPLAWQTSSVGLRTTSDSSSKTGGLSFIITQSGSNWPAVSMLGNAIEDTTGTCWFKSGTQLLAYEQEINLGTIKPTTGTATTPTQTSDWSFVELNYGSNLRLNISRLTAAMLVNSDSSSVRFFASTSAPQFKYIAYQTSSGIVVSQLSSSLSLSSMSSNWILVWYGRNSNFYSTKMPNSYECGVANTYRYQGDIPILFVFSRNPSSASISSERGIDLTFSGSAGNVVVMPLFGNDIQRADVTDTWTSLPSYVVNNITFWSSRLCYYPSSVRESYSYQSTTDTITITENINFVNVCSGTRFAPIQPFLAIAKDSVSVSFSGNVIDTKLPTTFGPLMGIENVNSYTWSISGLKKYTDSRIIVQNTNEPSDLKTKIEQEVNKMISDGHYRPWVFQDAIPVHKDRGYIYWDNPGETLAQLTDIAESISDTTVKNNFINYIKSERQNSLLQPENVFTTNIIQNGQIYGTPRRDYQDTTTNGYDDWGYSWVYSASCEGCRKDMFYKRVPLFNFYSLAKYYELVGTDNLFSQTISRAKTVLDQDMKEQDWATYYWFSNSNNFYSTPYPSLVSTRHLAGTIGYVKLMKMAGDSTENLGRYVFTRALITKVAMEKYPRYLYKYNLAQLPPTPDWHPKALAGSWVGFVFNYNWRTPNDDARKMAILNQYKTRLFEDNAYFIRDGSAVGTGYLIGYTHLVPEVGRILKDYAKDDSLALMKVYTSVTPNWYVAYPEGIVGNEHGLAQPSDGYQIFLAKAHIEKASAQELEKYIDISWLRAGDLFYINKIAQVIKSYKGYCWSDECSSMTTYTTAVTSTVTTSVVTTLPSTTIPSNTVWELTFSDEFDGSTIDRKKWNIRYQWDETSINNELQAYVDDAFELSNGILRIKAERRNAEYGGHQMSYTSGVISSADKFYQQYGYAEIRAKVPKGRGLWPAFWMTAQNETGIHEIDIFEILGDQPTRVYMSNHWGTNWDNDHNYDTTYWTGPDMSADFHTYGLEWNSTTIVWYIDGVQRKVMTRGLHNIPMNFIANLAVGGDWPGSPDASTVFPAYFEIDYIRVYKKADNRVSAPIIYPNNTKIFINQGTVEMYTSTPGAEIRYTLDGSTPTSSSTLYTQPITISNNVVVK
ncbi:MAG: family 16 glycosylhydrolase, partial [Candidatus Aenigmatarchaeota archaeon]|nr:family 16 glycosylhydrolase [Candidatus Aenigmarchaeota archaeon]